MEHKTDETESVPTPPSPDTVTITERPNTRSQALPRRSPRNPKPKAFGLLEPDIDYWSSFIEPYGTPPPIASKVKARKDPDLFNWDEAMASDYKQEFLKSAQAKIAALAAKGTWIEDLRTNATTRIVPNQWVFCIK
jgi:hypothetical protein